MPDQPDLAQIARSIVDDNRFMALGTADEDGVPWVSPVWFAPVSYRELLWASKPGARHSRNLATRPQIAIVIYDSHRVGWFNGLYMAAVAEELEDVDEAIEVYSRRSEEHGFRRWTREDVLPPGRFRLYRARVSEQFVLDDHDERLPVHVE
jgi:nitroimidazol reductase NimA-like FMN-containing flavoprotein (pyridoxamine 5'-phosphate oxidase superfamily)